MNDLLVPAVVALAGAIALLYRSQTATTARIETKLDACEKDRKELFERIIKIESSR